MLSEITFAIFCSRLGYRLCDLLLSNIFRLCLMINTELDCRVLGENLCLIQGMALLKSFFPFLNFVEFIADQLVHKKVLCVNLCSFIPHGREEFVHTSTWVRPAFELFFPINPILLLYTSCERLITNFLQYFYLIRLLLKWLESSYHLFLLLFNLLNYDTSCLWVEIIR